MPENYTFPKKERLLKPTDFSRVYASGKVYHSKFFVLYLLKAEDSDFPVKRAGFVTGRKIGKAVRRNKVKRWLREVYRLNKNNLCSGIELVIIAKKPAVELDFHEVEGEIIRLCKWAKVWVRRPGSNPPMQSLLTNGITIPAGI